MTDSAYSPHRSSRVVSVRLDTETITRLDRLAQRTSRSRGFYLKAAITEMLPALEESYWTQLSIRRREGYRLRGLCHRPGIPHHHGPCPANRRATGRPS